MVQATDFNSALREDALALNVSTGSVIDAPGEPTDFIFEFSRAEIRTFERVDSDLVIILEDGSVTRINGYYDSVYDRALVFHEELETTASTSGLALAGLGLLGAGGLAAAAGSGGSDSGGGPSIAITEDFGGADGVVSATERADGLPISGTATPGASIDVTLGRTTLSTTADADGNWSVTFPASSVPTGEQDVLVNATATDENGGTASDIASITIDTLVNDLTLDEVPEGGDGMVNAVEASDGVTLTGTVEPGATVVITFNGEDYDATVAADGTWTLDIPAADIPAGNGVSHTIEITATDGAGNTDTLSETFIVDTTLTGPTITAVPGGIDSIVNAEEAAAGVTVTGTVEPGSEVVVVFQGVEYPAAVDPDGNWMAPIPSSALPEGNGETHGFEVHAVDEAGNPGSTSGTFVIDTTGSEIVIDEVPGGDGVINEDEAGDGISLGGEVDPGSTVIVIFEEVEYPADVDEDGNWEVTIPAEDIPEGTGENSDITIVVTDPAGNVTEEPVTVEIDTVLENFTVTDVPGDDNIVENVPVVNIEETDGGVTISGTVEIGGTVSVIFEGITYEAVVEDNGDWSVDIPEEDIPDSNGDPYQIIVNAEDEAGNTGQIVEEFMIDNVAPEMPFISGFAGNTSGGFTDITIPTPEDGTGLSFHTSAGSNGTVQLATETESSTATGQTAVDLQQEVADLIISATDAANNTQSTYYVFEQGGQNTTTDLSNAAFGSHDITAVNLDFEEVNLVLTEADVLALSSDTDTLFVQGNADDSVTLTGATTEGNTMSDGTTGQTYTEYTLGEATIWIDTEIPTVNT